MSLADAFEEEAGKEGDVGDPVPEAGKLDGMEVVPARRLADVLDAL